MKISTRYCIVLLSTVAISLSTFAQKNFLKDADKSFLHREYFTAIELYKKAYANESKKENKAKIIFQTAECYRLINDTKNAEQWYEKAIKAKYPDPKAILYLADSKKILGKYDEALVQYNEYKKQVPSDTRGEDGAKSCELAQKWKDIPTRYKVENVAQINTKQLDFSPSYIDKKYTTLYFTSTREGATGGKMDNGLGQNFSDLFETKLDKNGKWSTPTPVSGPVNADGNDGSNVVNKKGNMMIFTRCNAQKGKILPCGLYLTTKKGQTWEEPTKLPFVTDSSSFGHPALNAEEDVLIFSSDMPGGFGEKDLWISILNKSTKEWGAPVNMGPGINTPGFEGYPFLRDDGTLYFASNGHLGMGGLDILKAKQTGKDKWAEVTNLQYPLNSNADDFAIIFEGKKDRGYFSSNREGGKGMDDIWQFSLPPLLFTIEGVVTDCKFKEIIEGITVKLVGSDGSTAETKTDKNGYYKFAENAEKRYVNENTSYVITTSVGNDIKTKEAPRGFVNSSVKAKETTVGVNESKIFKHDFCLIPIEKEIRFPDVLYDLNSAELRPESKDSLNFLYETLIDNPTFVIELSSHTDYRGSDPANQKLSEARAKSCVDYLISKGIPAARMVPKGYGEKRPVEVDADGDGKVDYILTQPYIDKTAKGKSVEEYEALMQKNRRTVFSVLRKDYVDPNATKVAPKTEEQPKKEAEE
ncbi:MAG: OmpA family protein [Bacteroidia bacterium]|nr:OmpA family protein [Bacteroidia bacterium]